MVADPIVGYFYKMYILGQPQKMAEVLAKWSTAATFVNAVISTVLVACLYNALRPILLRSGMILTKEAEINANSTKPVKCRYKSNAFNGLLVVIQF